MNNQNLNRLSKNGRAIYMKVTPIPEAQRTQQFDPVTIGFGVAGGFVIATAIVLAIAAAKFLF